MSTSLAIESTITSFQLLHERLGLSRASDASFFSEWQLPTVSLSEGDRRFLDHIRQRYYKYYNADLLAEGTVLLSIVAPLLDHLGFHEPPFFVRSEVPVRIEVLERDEMYRGRMDVLVIRDSLEEKETGQRLWVLTVEAKRSKFAADVALPQCLAYMSNSPQEPSFGLVTNGSDFMFCKLQDGLYDFSDAFSLLSRSNKLYEVAGVLAHLKKLSGKS